MLLCDSCAKLRAQRARHSISGVLWKRGHRFLRQWNRRLFVYQATKAPPLSYYDAPPGYGSSRHSRSGSGGGTKRRGAKAKGDRLAAELGLKPLVVAFPQEEGEEPTLRGAAGGAKKQQASAQQKRNHHRAGSSSSTGSSGNDKNGGPLAAAAASASSSAVALAAEPEPRGRAYVIDVSDRNEFPNFKHAHSNCGFLIRVMEVDYRGDLIGPLTIHLFASSHTEKKRYDCAMPWVGPADVAAFVCRVWRFMRW